MASRDSFIMMLILIPGFTLHVTSYFQTTAEAKIALMIIHGMFVLAGVVGFVMELIQENATKTDNQNEKLQRETK